MFISRFWHLLHGEGPYRPCKDQLMGSMVYVEDNKVRVKKEKTNHVEKRKITKKNALQEKKRENI